LRGFGASARGRRRCFSCFSVEELASVAGVSKCTLYKLFPGKDQLVAAYLRQARENLGTNECYLLRGDLAPRERLLALFRRPRASAPFRGCPVHNAAVELAGPDHPARPVVLAHKQAVVRLLADTARQGGAADPETLGHQLAVLLEGAAALATSIDDAAPFDYAAPWRLPSSTRPSRRPRCLKPATSRRNPRCSCPAP
jgi:AcrR family transcriptional regulator